MINDLILNNIKIDLVIINNIKIDLLILNIK